MLFLPSASGGGIGFLASRSITLHPVLLYNRWFTGEQSQMYPGTGFA